MGWLAELLHPQPPIDRERCDELCRLLREHRISEHEAWEQINESRIERGLEPIDAPAPSFEELMGVEEPYPR